jgi:hypothetical protein
MGYLNDFRLDPRWWSVTTVNGTELYFDKVEESEWRDEDIRNAVSKII